MHDDTPEMNAEPNAEPDPDQEAPGPHPPGTRGRVPWFAWVFILLAIGDLVWYVRTLGLPASPSISDVAVYALQVIPSVAVILLPAALLIRHRDVPSRARTLLFGTILYALVQGLLILTEPLQGFFESVTPASQELPFLVPLAALYSGLISVVTAFGLTYIAVGLSQARRYEDRGRSLTALFVPTAAIFGTVVGVLTVSRLQLGDTPMSPTLAIYLGASVVLGVVRLVVWVYLATVITRGAQAGEDPRAGWRLGMLGAGLVIIALVLVNLNGLLDIQDQAFVTAYRYAIILGYALGHVSLFGAFVVGLPASDEFDDDKDEFDDDDEDEFDDDEPAG